MNQSRFEIFEMVKLLRRSEKDQKVINFFGQQSMSRIERDDFYGSLEYKSEGVDVVFNEAPWVIPANEITDPKLLYLCAFHLHREGYKSYSGYSGQLPNEVTLGDTKAQLIHKIGQPSTRGGGSISLLKRPVPYWFRYSFGKDATLHFRFDHNDRVDMVTLATLDIQSGLRAGTTGTVV